MFKRLFSGSGMTRECPVRFCEGFSGKFRGSAYQKKLFSIFMGIVLCICKEALAKTQQEIKQPSSLQLSIINEKNDSHKDLKAFSEIQKIYLRNEGNREGITQEILNSKKTNDEKSYLAKYWYLLYGRYTPIQVESNPGIPSAHLAGGNNFIASDRDYGFSIEELLAYGKLPQVSDGKLDLQDFKICSLKGLQNIPNPKKLKMLNLRSNQITIIGANELRGFEGLKDIDLSFNRITRVTCDAFKDLKNLQYLSLGNNRIINLQADEFNGLKSLNWLGLSNNQISSIPAHVFKSLKNLRELEVKENQITMISVQSFKDLRNLQKLNLDGNKITVVEANVFDGLISLKNLELNNNQITSVQPYAFMGLTKLEHLGLIGNKITKLQANVFKGLDKLEQLDLDHNEINEIKDNAFNGLGNLNWLGLRSNRITRIFLNLFKGLNNLANIDLRGNKIEKIEANAFDFLKGQIYVDVKIDDLDETGKQALSSYQERYKLEHKK